MCKITVTSSTINMHLKKEEEFFESESGISKALTINISWENCYPLSGFWLVNYTHNSDFFLWLNYMEPRTQKKMDREKLSSMCSEVELQDYYTVQQSLESIEARQMQKAW